MTPFERQSSMRETPRERREQPQQERGDRGEGSGRESLQTSELDVLRTPDHQPQQANRSTELMRRIEADTYYRERSTLIERAIAVARENRISSMRIARERSWMGQEDGPANQEDGPAYQEDGPANHEVPLATNISERNPEREREPIENIVQTEMWKSEEVQNALTQLMKETPGSDEWNNQGANLIFEYQEQLEKINEERSESGEPPYQLVAHLDSISDALKPEGDIYLGRIRPEEES
jgi:hypothetical protein